MKVDFLSDLYIGASQEPAEKVLDYRSTTTTPNPVVLKNAQNKPLVWIVPNLISPEECQYLLQNFQNSGYAFGKDLPQALSVNSNNSNNGDDLSQALLPRLKPEFQSKVPEKKSILPLRGVSSKWRILKLQGDEEFPAHQDGMESYPAKNGDFCVSTHSVLLNLQQQTSQQAENSGEGTAIRFYYRTTKSNDCVYDNSMDVIVPNGYGIIMEQHKDLFYAIQPSSTSTFNNENSIRYVAQTSLMRTLPEGDTMESLRGGAATSFALGPGLLALMEEEAELAHGAASTPIGWGRHFNPKATLWRQGRPIIRTDPSMKSPQRLSLGLANERRWSNVNSDTFQNDVRRHSQLRKSLQSHVDPVRKLISYNADKRLGSSSSSIHKRDPLSDDLSTTSHTELSTSREEDPVTISAAAAKDYKPYEVTRKPRENSLVGRLSKVFQLK